jgi:hypothetical protein
MICSNIEFLKLREREGIKGMLLSKRKKIKKRRLILHHISIHIIFVIIKYADDDFQSK